jgi:hypothetical protein
VEVFIVCNAWGKRLVRLPNPFLVRNRRKIAIKAVSEAAGAKQLDPMAVI